MKRLIAASILAAGFVNPAAAATTSDTVNVDITLTSACSISTITPVTFAYTSLGGAVTQGAGDGAFTVRCTNNHGYTIGLVASGSAAAPAASIGPVTDSVLNLQYSLGLSATSGTGNGTPQSFNVTGSMGANQVGTCAAASCTNAGATNRVHTVVITY